MKYPITRRSTLRAGVAIGAAIVLPTARACDYTLSTLRVTHPWTRATTHDATSAVLCMKFDEVVENDRLVLVKTPVAESSQMGGAGAGPVIDFEIAAGRETYLDEAGTYVRLVGLRYPLEMGRSYPLLLGFTRGGAIDTVLTVDYTRFK